MQSISELIPIRLAELRKKEGYTQAEVGDCIGFNGKTYATYESGRAVPSLDTLFKLCKLYNYDTIDNLIFGDYKMLNTHQSDLEKRYRKLPKEKRKIVDFILQLP